MHHVEWLARAWLHCIRPRECEPPGEPRCALARQETRTPERDKSQGEGSGPMTREPVRHGRDFDGERRQPAPLGWGLVLAALLASAAEAGVAPDFERDIAPILKNRC